jgi:hypothetical protein
MASVIRVYTPTGIHTLEEADGYSIGRVPVNTILPDRNTPLRLWKIDPGHKEHKLIALFPGGWLGLDLACQAPAKQVVGFKA